MRKYAVILLCAVFFVTASLGFTRQSQEHQHRDTGRKQYEDREKRYQERMYWQMPLRVMDELGIREGMSVADVGAGIGYFTLKLSKKVGKTGKVFASDIDKDALAFLDERRREAGLENIAIIHGRADDPLIPEESADLFVQWDAEKMDPESPGWDPKDRELYTMHTMLNMIYDADYEVLEIKDFLPMQMIYICKPSDTTEQRIISNPVK
jgi:SAM-dependent methyltransferase